jgi:hypothetical protein
MTATIRIKRSTTANAPGSLKTGEIAYSAGAGLYNWVLAGLGYIGKKEAKRDLIKKVIDLLNTKGWFIEASLKMEEILSSSKVPVIDDEKVIMDIVGKDKKPEMGKRFFTS